MILQHPTATANTILTMGNYSQCGMNPGGGQVCNEEQCLAVIKSFQYGWGILNEGNKCKITILNQKGSTFSQWMQRIGITPEADAVPIQGKYRMKVQFGWIFNWWWNK